MSGLGDNKKSVLVNNLPSAADGQHKDAEEREDYRELLQSSQPFPEQDNAAERVGQRIDVVTEAGFEDLLVLNCPDVDEPVECDKQSRQRQPSEHLAMSQSAADLGPLPPRKQDHGTEWNGPDDSV